MAHFDMSPDFAYTKSPTSPTFGNQGKMIGHRGEEEVDEGVNSEEEYPDE
jgi:hypothetical protein